MDVWIAPGCITCGVCETICPEVFTVMADTAVVDPFGVPGREALCRKAQKLCPVHVIEVLEELPPETSPSTESNP